jgi:hypothetical protein
LSDSAFVHDTVPVGGLGVAFGRLLRLGQIVSSVGLRKRTP